MNVLSAITAAIIGAILAISGVFLVANAVENRNQRIEESCANRTFATEYCTISGTDTIVGGKVFE